MAATIANIVTQMMLEFAMTFNLGARKVKILDDDFSMQMLGFLMKREKTFKKCFDCFEARARMCES